MYFPSSPISFGLEITYACNNACPHCANVWEASRDRVLVEWRELLDRIAPPEQRGKYAELIRVSGGEPTLHPDFSAIIDYIDSFDIPFAVFTNGRWQEPGVIVETLRKRENLVGLLISLHGSDAEAHNAFIGDIEGAFEETCRSIRLAAEAGLGVFSNSVLTRYSCEQIESILELSQSLGASHAVFNRYLGKPTPLDASEAQLRNGVEQIETLRRHGTPCHIGDCVPPCFVRNASIGSNGGIEHCTISPDGLVRPDNLTSYTFGNLFEQSLEEIWSSEKAQWYRQQVPQQCFECAALPRCRGGVTSVAIEHGFDGDPLMKDAIQDAAQGTVELAPSWKISPNFSVREEAFGYLLTRYNWSIPVKQETKAILDAIQAHISIEKLQQEFGDEALELVAHLYQEEFVEFE